MIVLVEHNRLGDSDNTPLTLIGHHGGVSTANLGCASNGVFWPPHRLRTNFTASLLSH